LECGQIYSAKHSKDAKDVENQLHEGEIESNDENMDEKPLINPTDKPNEFGHICHMRYCHLCRSIHKQDDLCYVQPIVPKQKRGEYFIVIFKYNIIFKIHI